jgi:hypothetical protein
MIRKRAPAIVAGVDAMNDISKLWGVDGVRVSRVVIPAEKLRYTAASPIPARGVCDEIGNGSLVVRFDGAGDAGRFQCVDPRVTKSQYGPGARDIVDTFENVRRFYSEKLGETVEESEFGGARVLVAGAFIVAIEAGAAISF